MKLFKFIVYSYIILITFNLCFGDEIIDEKLVSLNYKKQERYLNAIFSENSFYVFTKYFDYANTPLNDTICWCSNINVTEYDYDFKILDEFKIESFVEDSIPYQISISKITKANDTLSIIGHIYNTATDFKKFKHHLFVLKYFQNKEIFRYFEIRDESFANQYDSPIYITTNYDYIYTIFKDYSTSLNKYDLNGRFIENSIIFDDSISNKTGKIGSLMLKNIHSINDRIFVFYSKMATENYKADYYYNVYDEEFNLLKEVKFLDSTYDLFNSGLKIFNIEDKSILIFGQTFGSLLPIVNLETWQVYNIEENSITKYENNLGHNYPDRINDIKKYLNGYICVGKFTNVPSPPYLSPLIQKTDSNFKIYESFSYSGYNKNFEREAEKIHFISEDEYIIISNSTSDFIYFINKFKTNFSNIKKNINSYLFPNPSNNFIKISNLINGANYTIFNIMGEEIMSGIYNNKINISTLTTGTYFIKYKVENETKFTKFIKL